MYTAMAKRKSEYVVDSAYFTVARLLVSEVVDVLKSKGGLNVAQYRLLLELYDLIGDNKRVSELAERLGMQPNVVTQTANELEKFGLVRRIVDEQDGRARFIEITALGVARVELVDKVVNEGIYSVFGCLDEDYARLLKEAILTLGASIAGTEVEQEDTLAISSQYLTALFTVEQIAVDAVKNNTDLAYNDARIMLLLHEVGHPMRSKDIARYLFLKPNNVSRAADRLVEKGYVQRLSDPENAQAVIIGATERGVEVHNQLAELRDTLANPIVFGCLDKEHAEVMNNVAQIVIDRLWDESDKAARVDSTGNTIR